MAKLLGSRPHTRLIRSEVACFARLLVRRNRCYNDEGRRSGTIAAQRLDHETLHLVGGLRNADVTVHAEQRSNRGQQRRQSRLGMGACLESISVLDPHDHFLQDGPKLSVVLDARIARNFL